MVSEIFADGFRNLNGEGREGTLVWFDLGRLVGWWGWINLDEFG